MIGEFELRYCDDDENDDVMMCDVCVFVVDVEKMW